MDKLNITMAMSNIPTTTIKRLIVEEGIQIDYTCAP
jgi:hypothetical protein